LAEVRGEMCNDVPKCSVSLYMPVSVCAALLLWLLQEL